LSIVAKQLPISATGEHLLAFAKPPSAIPAVAQLSSCSESGE